MVEKQKLIFASSLQQRKRVKVVAHREQGFWLHDALECRSSAMQHEDSIHRLHANAASSASSIGGWRVMARREYPRSRDVTVKKNLLAAFPYNSCI
jgi:hypothetical protein